MLEELIIEHCSPTLAGIKTGNLFSVRVTGSLSGKKIALFGSYGWGDGQWMRDWEDRCNKAGAKLVCDSVMANNAPGEDALEDCKSLGRDLV